ncbi:MAG: class I SAM-dependent methyltransferase [Ferruginibacter sp.]
MDGQLKKIFEKTAELNSWGDNDSLSGPGSNLIQTAIIRKEIPAILKKYQVTKMLDAPCGDFFWMRLIREELFGILKSYLGGDIVPQLIRKNNELYGNDIFSFIEFDITKDTLPEVDLIFTRDCFIHLSFVNIYKALKNYKNSGATYLLVSTYTKKRRNKDVPNVFINGRAINLQTFPFYFPKPLELINEECTEGNNEYADKSLALWKLKDINLNLLGSILFIKRIKQFLQRKINGCFL